MSKVFTNANKWNDQPTIEDGTTVSELFGCSIGEGHSIQIQRREFNGEEEYVITAGNLFGSSSLIGDDLEELLKTAHEQIYKV